MSVSHGLSRRAVLAASVSVPFGSAALSACSSTSSGNRPVRLGYFANLTHAVPMAGMARGTFARHLRGRTVEPQIFANGPVAVQALLAGALDIAYLGPNPAITAWVRTKGKGVHLVAGACQNGAALVARKGIDSLDGLRGRSVSTPQLGGTQDVALKYLLKERGIPMGGGSHQVDVLWMANAQTLDQFKQKRLDASYQAEPWVSRLVEEAGAHVLVDETTSWSEHRFATTSVVVSQDFLRRDRAAVEALMSAHVESTKWLRDQPAAAQKLLNAEIKRLTGKKLKPAVMKRAFGQVHFDWDPMLSNIASVAEHTWSVGEINVRPHLSGLAELGPLNAALRAAGEKPISQEKTAT